MNKRSGLKTKQRILHSAMNVFSKNGYAKTSMRMIASASNISVGCLYLYFKNKEDLYLSLVRERMEDFSKKMSDALKNIEDPVESMRTFITMTLIYAKKHKELILIQGKELGLTFGIDVKRKFFKSQARMLENIIKNGVKTGIFKKCNIKEAAKIIKCALRGFVLSIMIEDNAFFSPKECCNLLLRGIVRRDSR